MAVDRQQAAERPSGDPGTSAPTRSEPGRHSAVHAWAKLGTTHPVVGIALLEETLKTVAYRLRLDGDESAIDCLDWSAWDPADWPVVCGWVDDLAVAMEAMGIDRAAGALR